ncbi:heterokaryon incompatibility protein-domain-containing protein [Podospora aff. communis PSN243]|uniref:Heterokaryon incompatibility protein-domain-containing protein n=1 Tax=Podospora aff. communis PSN243 TaxID=3040156 RepID=A0AAV9GKX8_9PEZI|nr:heterokaryon incompatibility protein-domain-containing protein [Podospora aff. communis PSN243]
MKDCFSRNHSRFGKELRRDTERQTELQPFLHPHQGSSTTAAPFTYDALPQGHLVTRVLYLRGGNDLETIDCRLETADLSDPGLKFEALSYCWGSPEAGLSPIYCNGKRFNVTKNLKMALNNLRPSQGERVLWVDAVCINQEDKEECARQVLKMGDIYGRATNVVIWLGDSSAACRASFSILKTFSGLYENSEGVAVQYEELKKKVSSVPIEGYPGSTSFESAFSLVQEMAEMEWFTRMWVLQEVALAKSVSLVCGQHTLPWDTFERGMLVRALVATRDRRSFSSLSRELDLRLLKIVELRMALITAKLDRSILTLLNQFREHKASVPADKVYAISSLTDTMLSSIGLQVDYSISTAEFYTDLARGILQNRSAGGLDILSVPRANSDLAGELPTWVPDWSDDAGGARPLAASVSRYGDGNFYASGKSAADPSLVECSETSLVLRGYVVDRIDRYSSEAFTNADAHLDPPSVARIDNLDFAMMDYPLKRTSQLAAHYEPVKKCWKDFLHDGQPYSTPKPQEKDTSSNDTITSWPYIMVTKTYTPTSELLGVAYVRTLCADSFPPFIGLDVKSYKLLINALGDWIKLNDVSPHGMWNVLHRFSSLDDGDQKDTELSGKGKKRRGLPPLEFPKSMPRNVDLGGMMDMMIGRKLMWTRDGYFGSVPADAREGDAIVLVEGCRVPLVLRLKSGGEKGGKKEWQLVGDCFMHGAMYGERWRQELCEEIILV